MYGPGLNAPSVPRGRSRSCLPRHSEGYARARDRGASCRAALLRGRTIVPANSHRDNLSAAVRYALETTRATAVCPFHSDVISASAMTPPRAMLLNAPKDRQERWQAIGTAKLSGRNSSINSAKPQTANVHGVQGVTDPVRVSGSAASMLQRRMRAPSSPQVRPASRQHPLHRRRPSPG